MLERLEAFRDLIRHGNALLGEVVTYCREAEAAVSQLAAEKQAIDRMRTDLEEAKARADAQEQAARAAMTQVDLQRNELASMRAELERARSEVEQFQHTQNESAEALERSLRETKQQQVQLEQELQRVRTQSASSRAIDARINQLDQLEAKMRTTEKELAETRRALEEERSRRDRAIALIRPKSAQPERA